MELLSIIDGDGNTVGWCEKTEAHLKGYRHRSAAVLLFKNGRVLLQKRGAQQPTWPGYWDCTSSGHVKKGERVEKAAARELKEEAGVKEKIEPLTRFRLKEKYGKYRENEDIFVFQGITRKSLKANEEVERFKSFAPKQFKELKKVTPLLEKARRRLLKIVGEGGEQNPFVVSRRATRRVPRRAGRKQRGSSGAPAKRKAKRGGLPRPRRARAKGRGGKRASKRPRTRR